MNQTATKMRADITDRELAYADDIDLSLDEWIDEMNKSIERWAPIIQRYVDWVKEVRHA